MAQPSDNAAADGRPRPAPETRAAADAERMAEEWAGRIGRWIVRGAARAKEEAEDIWAEAQALRRDL